MDETMDRFPHDIEAALAAAADGSLTGAERERVLREAAAAPEQARSLARQHSALAALRALDAGAPDTLRHAIATAVAQAEAPQRPRSFSLPRLRLGGLRPRTLLAGGGAFAAAAVVLALVLSSGGTTSPPTVQQAARVALRSASAAAPASQPGDQNLDVSVDGIVYPTWSWVGWHAVGQRSDSVGGHAIRTVFYANRNGARIGYAIAAGHALPVAGGRVVDVNGAQLRVLRLAGGAQIVTWRRGGHTCILAAGRDVPTAHLVALASYET